ncbi:MAG: phosphotransferase family protein [Trebonia sp.]
MTQLHIPDRWNDLSAQWMTAALSTRFPGAEVATASLVWVSEGTNRRARFGLTYSSGTGPEVVFVKAEGDHRELHAQTGNLFNEPLIFASGLPLPVDHPEPYRVLINEAGLDWLVVMEDVALRGGDARDSTQPLTIDQAANGVRGLARLHRAYWGFTGATHPALAWVRTWQPSAGFHSALAERIPLGMERAGDRLPAELRRWSAAEIVDLVDRYLALLGRDPTLLHADAHIGNTYVLPDDDVGFLDWQVARRGHWSQDVGYFLQGALVETDRRAAEQELIAAYAKEVGRGVDQANAWRWYRASPAYGLPVWLSTLGTDGYQRHEVSVELVARYGAAAVELGTVDALTALESEAD